jgi:hypothetical protein
MDLGQNEHDLKQTAGQCLQTLLNLTIFLNNISNIYIFNIKNIFKDLSNDPDYYKY